MANRAGQSARSSPAAPGDRRLLTLSPYGVKNPASGGTKRIFYLNRGYARAGWEVLQISSTSIGRGIRQTIRSGLLPLLGPRRSEIAPGYREEAYFNPFVILGNRLLRSQGAAQVASSILPKPFRPTPRMKREIATHRYILFEHPQMFDMAEQFLRDDHIVLLDAHNIESRLYPKTEGDSPLSLAARVALRDVERRAMKRADAVLTCSGEDRASAIAEYDVDPARILVAPNGVDTDAIRPSDPARRADAKGKRGLAGTVAIFVGSRWGPNTQAAARILACAHQAPEVTWLIVGTVGEDLAGPFPPNVVVTGPVDCIEDWYATADVAINPMEFGSGSNIKMFEYLAAGLPIVTTSFGARGVEDESGLALSIAAVEDTPGAVRALVNCPRLPARRIAARLLAESRYDWTRIAVNVISRIETVAASRARA